MNRQHTAPLLLTAEGGKATRLEAVELSRQSDGVAEALIQSLVHDHPDILPIAEIDVAFVGAIPICTELSTPAGPIDNFLVTPSGLPVLVECKLWRNPQARREVVGQILDYSKELSRFTSSDIEREAARRGVASVVETLRATGAEVDEIAFHDALTANLRRGRCLLLIVGDGIRESVEAIFEHLRESSVLHFSLGLVELPIYRMPDGGRLIAPRVLARTEVDIRRVIELPEGLVVADPSGGSEDDTEGDALDVERRSFWAEFLSGLELNDPEQPVPRPSTRGHISFMMPCPGGNSWITVYRDRKAGEVGLFLSYTRGTIGHRVSQALIERWDAEIGPALGGTAEIVRSNDRERIYDKLHVGSLDNEQNRNKAITWLRGRVNDFVNALRPMVRATAADLADD